MQDISHKEGGKSVSGSKTPKVSVSKCIVFIIQHNITWTFFLIAEGLHVPVIPRAKLSGVSTVVGLPMTVRLKRIDQTKRD